MEYIRNALEKDSEEILKIYSYYIKNTSITFEIDVPTLDEFTERVRLIIKSYPYIVYVIDEKIVGYAYASKHRERAAYVYDVEVSVYLEKDCLGKGIGSKLYEKLFDMLLKQGFYNVYSGITMPNEKSENLHKRFQFEEVGTYKKVGFKHGKWHDVKWFQKALRDHDENPKALNIEAIKA